MFPTCSEDCVPRLLNSLAIWHWMFVCVNEMKSLTLFNCITILSRNFGI